MGNRSNSNRFYELTKDAKPQAAQLKLSGYISKAVASAAPTASPIRLPRVLLKGKKFSTCIRSTGRFALPLEERWSWSNLRNHKPRS
ncbi:hypothetical protein J3R74_001920 [Puniceicoccus vermicola]